MKYEFSSKLPADFAGSLVKFSKGQDTFWEQTVAGRILNLGLGDKTKLNRRELITLIRKAISTAKSNNIKELAISVSDLARLVSKNEKNDWPELFATNAEMANFEFNRFKTAPKDGWKTLEKVVFIGTLTKREREALARGELTGEAVNICRTLANTPGGLMTPRLLAEAARDLAGNTRIKTSILDETELRDKGFHALLSVGQGSAERPRLIVLEYYGAGKKSEKPVVLVGKGITFDTGGLNLKSEAGLSEMHMDMSGGAAVIASVVLAAKLGLKKNIIGIVPAVENMPSGSSYRPGDILQTLSGQTIEVLNTDAEGRIVLADALTYALEFKPRLIVDVATLTGAAMTALGQRATALFTKSERLEKLFRALGELSGDYVWPLPLWDEYEADIKGTFGDLANVGKTRYGGATAGAMFLYQFVKESKTPWVHLDIAPTMTSIDGQHLAKGATGVPVRLLIKLLEKY